MQSSITVKNNKRNNKPLYDKKYLRSNFQSCLRYSTILWGEDNESNKMFKLQNVLLIICGVNNTTSCRSIFKDYNK
jgi:hypothetical protein